MGDAKSTYYIVAVAAIIVRDGKILAMRRAANNVGPGLWETVSGRVDAGEEPFDAVRREIAEESGLTVAVEPRPLTSYQATRAGEPMMVIVYRAEYVSGEVVRSDEHDEHAWLSAAEFAERSTLTKLVETVRRVLA